MITKITDENRQSYDARFDLLNDKLAAAGFNFQVKNVASLFANLSEIANAQDPDTHEYLIPAEYYVMLPADEPFFEINANTRVITVPEPFKKNGVSIQNDHLAEIVYFKIDRYFDRNDLANDTNIYIDWKIGKKEGRSEALWPTTNIDTGYIIFGWGISEAMTAEKGSIQFAVRIESDDKTGDNIPDLIFNTLVATVNINAGLNINKETEAVSVEDSVRARFINSSYTPESFDPLTELQWAVDGNLNKNIPYYYDFIYDNPDPEAEDRHAISESDELPLTVTLSDVGRANDETYSYYWIEQGGAANLQRSSELSDTFTVQASDDNETKNKYYYVRVQGRKVISDVGNDEEFYKTTKFLVSDIACIPKATAPVVDIAGILTSGSGSITPSPDVEPQDNGGVSPGNPHDFNVDIQLDSLVFDDNNIFVPVNSAQQLKTIRVNYDVTGFEDNNQIGKISKAYQIRNSSDQQNKKEDFVFAEGDYNNIQKISFGESLTLSNLEDGQVCDIIVKNTRNHSQAYSNIVTTKIFRPLPEASLFDGISVALQDVSDLENPIDLEWVNNGYTKQGSQNLKAIASISIPEIFKDRESNDPNICSVTYKWVKTMNDQSETILAQDLDITGSTAMSIQPKVTFRYYNQETEIVGPSYGIGIGI